MAQGNHYHDEDFNSHELRSTRYQPYQHPFRSQDHNAFGDDSDSEENHPHPAPQDDPSSEFDVYRDFNNSGVRYTTLLRGTPDERKADPEELHGGLSNKIRSPILDSEKSRQNRSEDQSFMGEPSISQPGRLLDRPGSASRKGKPSQLKPGKNRWKIGSIIAFLLIACLAIVIFFLMPRQPFISFEAPPRLLKKENNNLFFSASKPTNFSFDAQLEILLDGRSSYLPTLIRDCKAIVSDLGATSGLIRIGKSQRSKSLTASNKKLTPLSLDVHFEYTAPLPSDTLWQTWRQACGNIAQSTTNGTITRPSLQLVVLIQFEVIGMIGTKFDSTQINNVGCPAELPPGAPSF